MKYFDSFILTRAIEINNERISKGWDFLCFLEDLMPGLNEFCHRKLQDENFVKYNKAKAKIFKETTRLIDEYDTNENHEKLWGYVVDHIGWYWD